MTTGKMGGPDAMNDIVVTDHALRARLQFPGARILARCDEVIALPDGARVRLAAYRIGAPDGNPVTAARALVARGVLVEQGE